MRAVANVLTFEPDKAYLRGLIANQLGLTLLCTGYVREAHERFEAMQDSIHGGEPSPSSGRPDEHGRDQPGPA